MAERSKRINLYDPEKAKQINPETLKLFQKYQVDMSIRDLSPNSVYGYNTDLMQWFIFMYDKQFNLSVLEATDEEISQIKGINKQMAQKIKKELKKM